jgi:hypothetical protein
MVFLLFARSIDTHPNGREGCRYGTRIRLMLRGMTGRSSSLFGAPGVLDSGDFLSGGAECLSEARCAEHFDYSLEVVSHDRDTDFSLNTCQDDSGTLIWPSTAV